MIKEANVQFVTQNVLYNLVVELRTPEYEFFGPSKPFGTKTDVLFAKSD